MGKGATKTGNPNSKLRGVRGGENGRRIPFRNGGSKCNLSTTIGRTVHPCGAGAKLVTTMVWAHAFGFDIPQVSDRLMNNAVRALERCTRPMAVA